PEGNCWVSPYLRTRDTEESQEVTNEIRSSAPGCDETALSQLAYWKALRPFKRRRELSILFSASEVSAIERLPVEPEGGRDSEHLLKPEREFGRDRRRAFHHLVDVLKRDPEALGKLGLRHAGLVEQVGNSLAGRAGVVGLERPRWCHLPGHRSLVALIYEW